MEHNKHRRNETSRERVDDMLEQLRKEMAYKQRYND
jgi:hypothetical protein